MLSSFYPVLSLHDCPERFFLYTDLHVRQSAHHVGHDVVHRITLEGSTKENSIHFDRFSSQLTTTRLSRGPEDSDVILLIRFTFGNVSVSTGCEDTPHFSLGAAKPRTHTHTPHHHTRTFLASSWKKSLASAAMRSSSSMMQTAISLICPFTFTMSLRMRCVRTCSVFFRTCRDGSRSLPAQHTPVKLNQNTRQQTRTEPVTGPFVRKRGRHLLEKHRLQNTSWCRSKIMPWTRSQKLEAKTAHRVSTSGFGKRLFASTDGKVQAHLA